MQTRLLIFLIIIPVLTMAQSSEKKLVFGIKLGLGKNSYGPDYTDSMGNQSIYSSRLILIPGVRAEIRLGSHLTVLTEADLVTNTSNIKTNSSGYYYTYHSTGNFYIQFTPNLLYSFEPKKDHFEIGGAPSIAINISQNGASSKPDIGINLLARFRTAIGFSFEINYTKGLSKLSSNDLDGIHLPGFFKTNCLGFSIGYVF